MTGPALSGRARGRYDVAIVGAGCAGLSLAWELAKRERDWRVVLVDPRTEHGHDRTWCFWNVEPHDFEAEISHRWSRWRVRAEGGSWVERAAPGLEYQHLPSDRFYARVLARLRARAGVELRLGEAVHQIRESKGEAIVETDTRRLRARVVFDSRPPARRGAARAGRDVALLQSFEGWVVEHPDARFDPGVATLMDFAAPEPEGPIHFAYVLPFSPRSALVEATWFGARVLPRPMREAALERILRQRLGLRAWSVAHRERGALPMRADAFDAHPSRRVYRIGLAGGAAKPSTGYAFQAIQRTSRALAEQLEQGWLDRGRLAPSAPRPWGARTLDRVFLSYLVRAPEAAPALFVSLFERVEPRALARFLADRASPAETLAVMRAMPFAPLSAEALRAAPLWLRR